MARNATRTQKETPKSETKSTKATQKAKEVNAETTAAAAALTDQATESVVFGVGSSKVIWSRPAGKKKMATVQVIKDGKPVMFNDSDTLEMGAGRDQTLANVAFYALTRDKQFLSARNKDAAYLSRTMEGDQAFLLQHHDGVPAEIKNHTFVASDKKQSWEKMIKASTEVEILEDNRIKKESGKSTKAASAAVEIALPTDFDL